MINCNQYTRKLSILRASPILISQAFLCTRHKPKERHIKSKINLACQKKMRNEKNENKEINNCLSYVKENIKNQFIKRKVPSTITRQLYPITMGKQ